MLVLTCFLKTLECENNLSPKYTTNATLQCDMSSQMPFQTLTMLKRFNANCTTLKSLSSVSYHVSFQASSL